MTPQLRFPEFTDEWQSKSLGSLVAQMQSGLSRRLSSEDIGLPVIRSNNIKGQSIDVSDISYWYINDPQGAKISNYILEYDDLLVNFINSISQIGKFAIYNNEAGRDTIFTTNIMRLKFKDGVDSRFIAHKFSTKRYNDYIDSITKPAVNQASFTTVDFKKFTIPLPSNQEQEKIAKFLTAVDKRIAAGEKKLELLQKYKKGVMQKIFTQQIRFKDENGNPYPEWEEKKFDEVLHSVATKQYQIQSSEYADVGSFPVVDQGQRNVIGYSDQGEKAFRDTPVIIFGDHTTILKYIDFDFIVGADGTKILKPKNNDDIKYLFYYLEQHQIIPEGYKRHFSTLKIQNILLPHKEEQQKIATFLTALDAKIAAEQTRLTAAKQWKKGLLQRMFI